MHIVHAVASMHPRHGGPSRSVLALVNGLAKVGQDTFAIATQAGPREVSFEPSNCRITPLVSRAASQLDEQLGLAQRRGMSAYLSGNHVDIVHSHGVWHPACHWSVALARKYGVPVVLQPRGMLEPWALTQRAWKKRLALLSYQRTDLECAAALVATSEMEYEGLRAFGLRNPIAVIPNGVDLPPESALLRRLELGASRPRIALFLSRVHPKKGVTDLVRAWAQCNPEGWRLKIAGPDQDDHLREVLRVISLLGVQGCVDYVGEVDGDAKASLFRTADLFVLPTYSENFGLVVAEALSFGVPVITTRGAPWSALVTNRCGWWVKIGIEHLVEALREAIALPDSERRAMGLRGREYVRHYDWDVVAMQTLELYRWILGCGEPPDRLRID